MYWCGIPSPPVFPRVISIYSTTGPSTSSSSIASENSRVTLVLVCWGELWWHAQYSDLQLAIERQEAAKRLSRKGVEGMGTLHLSYPPSFISLLFGSYHSFC